MKSACMPLLSRLENRFFLTLILLLSAVFLTGCSEAFKAGKVLQKSKYELAEQLLYAEYVRQIGDAKDILKYSPEKNVVFLILENGTSWAEQPFQNGEIVSVSRQYSIRKLAFSIFSVNTGEVRNSREHGLVSSITLNYTVEEINAECGGIPVTGIYRGTGQTKNSFLAGLEAVLPPKELDYSSIIHRRTSPARRLISKTFGLAYRSGAWYPAGEAAGEVEYTLKDVCNVKEQNSRLEAYFKGRNFVRVHDSWVRKADVPYFRKLKAGYRLEGGKWVCHTWDEYRKTRNAEVRERALKQLNYLDNQEAESLFRTFKMLLAGEICSLVKDSNTGGLQNLQNELGKMTDIPEQISMEIEQFRKALQLLIKYPDCGKSMLEYLADISPERRAGLETALEDVKDPADRDALDTMLKELIRKRCSDLLRKEPRDNDSIRKFVKEYDEWPFLRELQIPEPAIMRYLCGKQLSWRDISILLEHCREYPERCPPEQIFPAVESVIEVKIANMEQRCLRNIRSYEDLLKLRYQIQSLPAVPGFSKKRLTDLCTQKLDKFKQEYEISVVTAESPLAEEFAEKRRKLLDIVSGGHDSLRHFYHFDRAAGFSISCKACRGTGKVGIPCSVCRQTGICQRCKGRGVYYSYEASAVNKEYYGSIARSCSVHCQSCRGRKMLCSKCLGHGFVPDYEKIRETMDVYSDFFHEEFLKIQKQKETPEKPPEKTPEKPPVKGWRKIWNWFLQK